MRAPDARHRRARIALAVGLALTAAGPVAAQDAGALSEQCTACHGEGGNSVMEAIPSLAGQPEYWITDQLILMRARVRRVEAMAGIVEGLGDAEIETLAAHYAELPPQLTGAEPDPGLVAAGEDISASRRCTSCHGQGLAGQEAIPRLAKQRIDYLVAALHAYRDGKRRSADTNMTVAVRGLSDDDLVALAHYASSR